jgi:hypothetical protein
MKKNQKLNGKINLSEKTVCLIIEFRKFGNTKRLQAGQITVDADADSVTTIKHLLHSPEIKAIDKHDGLTRNWLYTRCLTSILTGIYLLPHGLIEEVETFLAMRATERQDLVLKVASQYKALIALAKEKLRGIFNAADYPPLEAFTGIQGGLVIQSVSRSKLPSRNSGRLIREGASESASTLERVDGRSNGPNAGRNGGACGAHGRQAQTGRERETKNLP